MVEPKTKKHLYFAVFLLPSFVLYTIFFIYPFLNGLYISLTNWDGLTPRSPIVMDGGDFENLVLGKLKSEKDREYLLSVYARNGDENAYSRLSLSGFERRKVESIFRKAGYESEANRFVGLKNYRDIIGGKVSESFYPRSFDQSYYNTTSSIPQRIAKKDLQKNLLSKLSADERALFDSFYEETKEDFSLRSEWNEFSFEDKIWLIPEFEVEDRIKADSISALISSIRSAALARDRDAWREAVASFVKSENLSAESAKDVESGAEGLWALGELKPVLGAKWTSRGFDLGVIGFTAFFAFFSVIGINLLAFLLALALDTGIKGQKFLRSVFFLPNVLSMVIVALIWKMLFFQMFPRVTGIDQWLSDPAKTPWLIVMVAIWQGAGYYMIVYLAGLQNIPTDVVEAAKIDGASPWQRFTNITMPLLVPALTISFFLTIANALKSFDLIYAMTSGSAYTYGTVPVVLDIFFDAFARKRAGLATAKAMLLFTIIFIVTGIQLYIMKKKEVEQ